MNLSNQNVATKNAVLTEFSLHTFAEIELKRPHKLALQEQLVRVNFCYAADLTAALQGAVHGCI